VKEQIKTLNFSGDESVATIAKKVGVSTATISRVLNNSSKVRPETRQMVLKAVNETRFSLRKPTPDFTTIGVSIFDFHPNLLASLYLRDGLAGIAESACQHGFNIKPIDILGEKRANETYAQLVYRLGLAGIIHVGLFNPALTGILEIAEAGFPQFVIGGRVDHPRVNWMDAENVESSRKAIKYLLNLGHRRIAIMTANLNSIDQMDRYHGYRKALEDAGMEINPDFVMERLDINPKSGVSATTELLAKSNPPTAIFYTNGELAIGGIKACTKMGLKIPEDISFLSFDDSRLPEFLTPSLTYILLPVYELAKKAGQHLATQLKHNEENIIQEVVIPDFFINESTGPVKPV
jgi:LacI family transcriptional regulator